MPLFLPITSIYGGFEIMAKVKDILNDLAKKLLRAKELDAPALQRMKKVQDEASKVGKEVQAGKG